MRYALILVGFTIVGVPYAEAQLAPNAPEDRPLSVQERQLAAYAAAIAPYVAEARRTYPSAKKRYQSGLAAGQTFYLTTLLRDAEGRWEQVFILVQAIDDQTVTGTIASGVQLVSGYEFGQTYSFDESEIIDWLITKRDGSEEGNVVGKFLDTYRP